MKTAQKILPLYKEGSRVKSNLEKRLDALEARFESKSSPFIYPSEDGLIFLDESEILRCEASSNYVNLILVSGEKRCLSKCLKWVENRLSKSDFIRVHNSHIVQINQIRKFSKGSLPTIELSNGDTVPVSRSKKTLIYNSFIN